MAALSLKKFDSDPECAHTGGAVERVERRYGFGQNPGTMQLR